MTTVSLEHGRLSVQPVFFGVKFKPLVSVDKNQFEVVRATTELGRAVFAITFREKTRPIEFSSARHQDWVRAFTQSDIPIQDVDKLRKASRFMKLYPWSVVVVSAFFAGIVLLIVVAAFLMRLFATR